LRFEPGGLAVRSVRSTLRLWLLGDGDSLSVDFFQDGIAATPQERFADFASQFFRIIAVAGLAQDLRAVWIGDYGVEMKAPVPHLCGSADRYLAASAQFVQQSSLARGRSARSRVIEKGKVLPDGGIALADLNP